MRTLVISDLHLGIRLGRDVLRRPRGARGAARGPSGRGPAGAPRRRGGAARGAAGAGHGGGGARAPRHRRPDGLAARGGRRPGKPRHRADASLAAHPRHGAPLDAAHPGGCDSADAPAHRLARSRAGASHYPGIWLADAVWATHGHYLDRHLLPESAFGIARGLLGRLPRDGARPADYEQAGGPSLTRVEAFLTRWLPRPLAALADDLAEVLRAATMPGPERLLSRRAAPLTARVLGAQMRRASIPALARVVHRLGVEADWVRVRSRAPLRAARGRQPERLAEPGRPTAHRQCRLLGVRAAADPSGRPPHPYWPGGAVVLEDGRAPRPIGLLDHLSAADLH